MRERFMALKPTDTLTAAHSEDFRILRMRCAKGVQLSLWEEIYYLFLYPHFHTDLRTAATTPVPTTKFYSTW